MLDSDYLTHYTELTQRVTWNIELPDEFGNFFTEKGPAPPCASDERIHQRFRVRTHGILYFTSPLPAFPRTCEPTGIYTCDLSRQGFGFLASYQLFPEEEVRIVLPNFWVRLLVVRSRRVTRRCYEIGTTLLGRLDPSDEAFASPQLQTV